MTVIVDSRICRDSEKRELATYLREWSSVPWVADLIEQGAKVSKGLIIDRSELGNTKTIWKNLGGVESFDEYHVNQVVDILNDNINVENDRLLNKINKYKKMLESNELELKITIFEVSNEHIIVEDALGPQPSMNTRRSSVLM